MRKKAGFESPDCQEFLFLQQVKAECDEKKKKFAAEQEEKRRDFYFSWSEKRREIENRQKEDYDRLRSEQKKEVSDLRNSFAEEKKLFSDEYNRELLFFSEQCREQKKDFERELDEKIAAATRSFEEWESRMSSDQKTMDRIRLLELRVEEKRKKLEVQAEFEFEQWKEKRQAEFERELQNEKERMRAEFQLELQEEMESALKRVQDIRERLTGTSLAGQSVLDAAAASGASGGPGASGAPRIVPVETYQEVTEHLQAGFPMIDEGERVRVLSEHMDRQVEVNVEPLRMFEAGTFPYRFHHSLFQQMYFGQALNVIRRHQKLQDACLELDEEDGLPEEFTPIQWCKPDGISLRGEEEESAKHWLRVAVRQECPEQIAWLRQLRQMELMRARRWLGVPMDGSRDQEILDLNFSDTGELLPHVQDEQLRHLDGEAYHGIRNGVTYRDSKLSPQHQLTPDFGMWTGDVPLTEASRPANPAEAESIEDRVLSERVPTLWRPMVESEKA